MNKQECIELKKVLTQQEEMLRFEHFSNQDAWELGSFLVKKVYAEKIALAIAIRKPTGNILFQHCTENTSLNNQNWMQRKFNTILLMECSSLAAWAQSLISGEEVATHGLDSRDYVFCGGGFPIRLKTGEMVAVLTVSNLPHEQDHDFIITALSEWLHMKDVPGTAEFFA